MNQRSQESFESDDELDELERLSNGALDQIIAGRLEDAERACRDMERRFPNQIDWIERTAMLLETRGDSAAAIRHYRLCLDFIERNPEGFVRGVSDWYRQRIELLDSAR